MFSQVWGSQELYPIAGVPYVTKPICKLLTGIAWLDWVIAHVGKNHNYLRKCMHFV